MFWSLSGDIGDAQKSTFLLIVVLGLCAAVLVLTIGILWEIPGAYRAIRGISFEDHARDLESRGKARRDHFTATRALTAEDYTISGLTHFLDIGRGRILCLRGQNYYDFEPIEDDPEVNQDRQFPTRDFTVLFLKKNDSVLQLYPGSEVFEPECMEPIIEPRSLYDLGFKLEDGEIVTGIRFEELERALALASRKG